MKQKFFNLDHIPALLIGEKSDKVYLFIHGQNGNKEEATKFAEAAVIEGWQVLGIDLPEHGKRKDDKKMVPWDVVNELKIVNDYLRKNWNHVAIRANSIGAWFSMLAFQEENFHNCLFVSPILDMEKLIVDMMQWARVTEEQLQLEKEIKTEFGQTLSWEYLMYVRENPIVKWNNPTKILYAQNDNMTQRETIDQFIIKYHCHLSVMPNGEHWFHTTEQLQFMQEWEKIHL